MSQNLLGKPDKFSKALELIESAGIQEPESDVYLVPCSKGQAPHKVLRDSDGHIFCDCEAWGVCKHEMASFGAAATLLVMEIRAALNLDALKAIGDGATARLKGVPDKYRALARAEYTAAKIRLEKKRGPFVAPNFENLISPKQIVAIRAIANSLRIDVGRFVGERTGCAPEELSRNAAAAMIGALKKTEKIAAGLAA